MIALAVSVGTASCRQAPPPVPATVPAPPGLLTASYEAPDFTLKVPEYCEVASQTVQDFDLYFVTTLAPGGQKDGLVGIYAGRFPDFPHKQDGRKSEGTLNGLAARIVDGSGHGTLSKEFLVRGGRGMQYHLWYVDQTPERAKLADEILQTFKLK